MKKEDIAKILSVSLRTVENWISEGTLPAPQRIGNRVYWHPDDFYRWLSDRLLADPAVQSPARKPARESSRLAGRHTNTATEANWNDTV